MNLSDISIGIKTFLRDDKLYNTINAIGHTLPDVRLIIADCGDHTEEKEGVYTDLRREGHTIIHLPFDAGFGAMSNAIADAVQTPYLLVGSDDFNFHPPYVRMGVEDMKTVLDYTELSIVSGRVRGPYEFTLEDQGDTIIEHKIENFASRLCRLSYQLAKRPLYFLHCDLTVNYSLIRGTVFQKVRWDNDVKIGGGEHGAWFLDVKRAGFTVAYVPGVQIDEQKGEDSPQYKQFRSRASDPARPCFDRRGIRRYVLGNGKVDYER